MIDGWDTCCEIALRKMPQDLTDDKPTLVHVMAWCRQATSHYLSLCWLSSMSPYGVTRPQWLNAFWLCNRYNALAFCPVNDFRSTQKTPLDSTIRASCGGVLCEFKCSISLTLSWCRKYHVNSRKPKNWSPFSNAYFWITRIVFWFKFYWILFPDVQISIIQHWFR